jgi:acetyltransferase-like isoleucine patch superfamily enzyme
MLFNIKGRLRYRLFRRKLLRTRNTVMAHGTMFSLQNLHVGSYCYIGPGAYWNAIGQITIEDGVIIGPRSMMWTENHNHRDNESVPYGGPNILKPIVVEEGVWIGADVKICPGVTIGRGAIVALGSVVVRDVAPFALVGGNPARLIRSRDNRERVEGLIARKSWYMKRKIGVKAE